MGQRAKVSGLLRDLPLAAVADDDEVLPLIEREALHGQGIGHVDAHLLTAVRLTSDARLWTRDKRLSAVAARLGLGVSPGSDTGHDR